AEPWMFSCCTTASQYTARAAEAYLLWAPADCCIVFLLVSIAAIDQLDMIGSSSNASWGSTYSDKHQGRRRGTDLIRGGGRGRFVHTRRSLAAEWGNTYIDKSSKSINRRSDAASFARRRRDRRSLSPAESWGTT